jgi:hypothetical protein
MKNITSILLMLLCLALSPKAQAVTPAPDGGYAGFNTAEGQNALFSLSSGVWNTALGGYSLFSDTSGSSNTAVGLNALRQNTTGAVIVIGAGGADVNDSCYIANIWNQPGGSQQVYVNSDGKLGFQVSSRRFKDQIKPLGDASEVIYGLKPVSFRYKEEVEPTRPIGFGLIAEDVEAVCADLVSRDADGTVNSVRYDAVNAMLLNEFLKEHNALIEEQRKLERLEATVTSLVAKVKEQAAQIQKVRTRVDPSRPASQVAVTDL